MYTKLRLISPWAATALALALIGLGRAQPAATTPIAPACTGCAGNVTPVPEGLLAEARNQIAELNQSLSNPKPCSEEDPDRGDDDNATVEHSGYYRWRLPVNTEETWDAVNEGTQAGTWYRYECFIPSLDDDFGYWLGVEEGLREFTAVNPQILAQVAIDDALALIPTQTIRTSPGAEGLVGLDTWFWVDGVPEQGVSATASVPGMEVAATARPGGVHFELGDRTVLDCEGTGVPWSPGATSDCTHSYNRAGHYTVTSTILWTGTYTLNGAGPYEITTAVPRTDSFELPVSEAQAINTEG